MFSRILFFMLLSPVMFLTSACQFFDNDKPDRHGTLVVRQKLCLETWPDKMNNFLEDKTNKQEVDEIFDCLQDALVLFTQVTRGAETGSYQADELQEFFNHYLLSDHQIQKSFMKQLMKVKALLLGGSEATLTRKEIDGLVHYLDNFRKQAQAINGRVGYLLFRGNPGTAESLAFHRESQAIMVNAFSELLQDSQAASSSYEFADLKAFFSELDFFLNMPDSTEIVRKWLPLVEATKDLFIAGVPMRTGLHSWQETSSWLVEAYFFVLQYYYQVQHSKLETITEWQNFMAWLDQGMDLLANAPQWKTRSFLPVEDIDRMIDELWSLEMVQTRLSSETVKQGYRKILAYMLGGKSGRDMELYAIRGVELPQVRILMHEYRVWKLGQLSILELAEKSRGTYFLSQGQLHQTLKNFKLSEAVSNMNVNVEEARSLRTSWDEWVEVFNGTKPPVWTKNGKYLLDYSTQSHFLNMNGLSVVNALRSVSRFVFRGYGNFVGGSIFKSTLNLEGLVLLEKDFAEAGRALGILDPRQEFSAPRTFTEASLFTPSGTGDDLLDGREMMQEVQMTVSGGRNMARQAMHWIREKHDGIVPSLNSDAPPLQIRLYEFYDFFKSIRAQLNLDEPMGQYDSKKVSLSKIFEGLPHMYQYLGGLDEPRLGEFYKYLLMAARSSPASAENLDYFDIRNAMVILYYVESTMITFDENQDGVLEVNEVLNAEPRFRSFVKKVSGKSSMLKEIFLYLVYFAKRPDPEMSWDNIKSFAKIKFGDLGTVDRLQLVKVLGALKKETK